MPDFRPELAGKSAVLRLRGVRSLVRYTTDRRMRRGHPHCPRTGAGQMSDREPVSHAIASIIDVLDCIAEMALQAENYDEVAAQEVGLGRIISRAQLVL